LGVAFALILHVISVAAESIALLSLANLFTLILHIDGSGADESNVLSFPERFITSLGISVTAGAFFGLILVLLGFSTVLRISALVASTSVWTGFSKRRNDELTIAYARADWEYLSSRKSGEYLNVMIGEIPRGAGMVRGTLGLTVAVVASLVYVTFALLVSATAVGLFIGVFALFALVIIPLLKLTRRYAGVAVEVNARIAQQFEELLAGVKITKALGAEDRVHSKLAGETTRLRSLQLRVAALGEVTAAAELGILSSVIVLAILHLTDLATALNAGVIGAILFRMSQRTQTAIGMVSNIAEGLPSLSATLESIKDLRDHEEETGGKRFEGNFTALKFEDVAYQYGPGPPVLQNLSCEIGEGEFVGVVGESGAGKTTLVNLTLGLLDPGGGRIAVNDISLGELEKLWWRRKLGYVPQDTVLFHDTIYNNIAAYRSSVSETDVSWAADIAQASEFIERFENGFEHVVGERGIRISGGQSQRIALARALATRPELLILDEATSSLDSYAESEFQKALENIRGSMTIIAVAHRLSTVMRADRVIVLSEGRIVETGPPLELLAIEDGYFKKLSNA
jgi:ABC-type multidrug transport system fused ATPase/permease subunit